MFRALAVIALAYSYFQIKTELPEVLARRPGIAISVWTPFGIGLLSTVILLSVPLIGEWSPELVHFGWRRLSDYTPQQVNRIMPLLKQMVGLMALAANVFFAFQIHRHLALAHSGRVGVTPLPVLAFLFFCEAIIAWYYLDRFESEAGH